jgi:F0F1-type ATP synthase assembly protein I
VSSGDDRQQIVYGLALVSVVSQVGCVTIVVIIGALLAGLGLDQVLDTRPLFTVVLLLASIPVSLYLLVRIALSTAAQLTPPAKELEQDESSDES